jgi:hypothetical protein
MSASWDDRDFKRQWHDSFLLNYDLYGPVRNVLDADKCITRTNGRGWGPGNRDFLGPVKWYRAVRLVTFWAQKSRDFATPLWEN